MIPKFIHGVIANVFTTFKEDQSLDDTGQRNFLDALLSTKSITAYFVRSGMGQMYTFSYEDTKQITRNVCEHMRDKGPVLVGTSGIWDRNMEQLPDPDIYTRQAIELSQYAQDQGASAVVLTIPDGLVPRGNDTPFDVCMRYFEAVDRAINIPIILYQPPAIRKAFRVNEKTLRAYAQIPNIKGIKISSDSAGIMLEACRATEDIEDFAYIVGSELGFYSGLDFGAVAVIGQGSCVNPEVLKAVQDRYDAGDRKGAIDAQWSTNMLVKECPDAVAFIKRYFNEQGYSMTTISRTPIRNGYRLAQPVLTDAEYERYKQIREQEIAKYK